MKVCRPNPTVGRALLAADASVLGRPVVHVIPLSLAEVAGPELKHDRFLVEFVVVQHFD